MFTYPRLLCLAAVLFLSASQVYAQWIPQQSNTTASLRGLSVVSARVAWASGSGGTVIRTIDGGVTWIVVPVPDANQLDLRAIAAFDDQHAVVAATAGRIWRTDNGGKSWSLVYQAADTAVFLDAIGFWPSAPGAGYARARGLVLADPIAGRFLILTSDDGGRTWHEAPRDSRPLAQPGEAAFAASGSSLVMHDTTRAWIGSGGSTARIFRTTDRGHSWVVASTPLSAPTGSAGVFSLSFADALRGIAIGGDFSIEGGRDRNVALTRDGGVTWEPAGGTPPNGYRSAVAIVPQSRGPVAVAVGPTGTDISLDGGRNWTPADTVGYHAVRFAPDGAGWATGSRGRVARFSPDSTKLRP